MTNEETLKLALEVIQDYRDEYGPWCDDSGAEYVIKAITEALANQEQKEDFFKQIGNQLMMQLWQNYCDVKVERDELQEKLAKQEQGEPVACLVGTKGSAFDTPKTKRAYTYAEQPNNVVAYKLGKSCTAAAGKLGGDSIDAGLSLLKELQAEGFGVFDLGAEYTTPQQRKPLTFEQVEDCFPERPSIFVDAYGDHQTSPQWLHDFARAIEAAHGIKE